MEETININGRVRSLYCNFVDRAATVKNTEAEEDFNNRLQSYISDIERDLGDRLTTVDCRVLYGTFELLQDIATAWRLNK